MSFSTLDSKTALVVIDLQQGIAAMPLVHPFGEIVARASTLAATFRERGLPVVLVTVDGAPSLRTEAPRRITSMPPGFAELSPELKPQPSDHRVVKQTPGAFTNTGLEAWLKAQGVSQIALVGVATGSGVEATARHAYELGFNIAFVIDAMTDRDADVHTNSVTRIFPKLGETGTTQELIDLLQRGV